MGDVDRGRQAHRGAVAGWAALIAVLLLVFGLLMDMFAGPGEGGNPVRGEVSAPLDAAGMARLQAAVAEDPTDTDALFAIGQSHFEAREWQTAIDWFDRLLSVDPRHLQAHMNTGTASFNLGREADARAAWLAALEIDPDHVEAHYFLAYLHAYGQSQDLTAAAREWQTVVELAPHSGLASSAMEYLEALAAQIAAQAPAGHP